MSRDREHRASTAFFEVCLTACLRIPASTVWQCAVHVLLTATVCCVPVPSQLPAKQLRQRPTLIVELCVVCAKRRERERERSVRRRTGERERELVGSVERCTAGAVHCSSARSPLLCQLCLPVALEPSILLDLSLFVRKRRTCPLERVLCATTNTDCARVASLHTGCSLHTPLLQ